MKVNWCGQFTKDDILICVVILVVAVIASMFDTTTTTSCPKIHSIKICIYRRKMAPISCTPSSWETCFNVKRQTLPPQFQHKCKVIKCKDQMHINAHADPSAKYGAMVKRLPNALKFCLHFWLNWSPEEVSFGG